MLFYGAGSSAVGVANMIATLFQKEGGLSEKEAKSVRPPFSLGLGLGLGCIQLRHRSLYLTAFLLDTPSVDSPPWGVLITTSYAYLLVHRQCSEVHTT